MHCFRLPGASAHHHHFVCTRARIDVARECEMGIRKFNLKSGLLQHQLANRTLSRCGHDHGVISTCHVALASTLSNKLCSCRSNYTIEYSDRLAYVYMEPSLKLSAAMIPLRCHATGQRL